MNHVLESQALELDWGSHLASRTSRMRSSAIREALKVVQDPEVISFAGGLPAADAFPLEAIQDACCRILQTEGAAALQYGTTEGHGPLREYLADAMCKYGLRADPDSVLLTNGSQQALDLIGKILLDPGDYVITSRPTYLGAIQAWNAYEARYETIGMDEDGTLVDEIESAYERVLSAIGKPPKFIYVLANFHNPAGTTLSPERRVRLGQIAQKLDLLIVEDDPYGQLRYEGEPLNPIGWYAPDHTIYLGTFSKTLAPGLRLGWIVCPKILMKRFVQAKQGADLHTNSLCQYIAYSLCAQGLWEQHTEKIRQIYRQRRDTMLDALAERWPAGCSWTRPEGGLFLWAQVPEYVDTGEFLTQAVREKVAYVPGVHFYPNGDGGQHAMRLNFSYAPPPTIVEGVTRLGRALAQTTPVHTIKGEIDE